MAFLIQIGNQIIQSAELPHLLAGHKILHILQREIIIDKAIASIVLTPEEKANSIKLFCQQNKLTTPEAILAVQRQLCINEQQFEAFATRELCVEKFKQATWGNKLEQYFLECKPKFDRVVYSLLRNDNREVVQELFFRIQDGDATFADCAREYSQGQEAQTGGLIGPDLLSQPHPAIAQKLRTSKPGQVLPPMKIDKWYIIIRLEQFISAQLDDGMKATLRNSLFEQWLAEEINNTPISLIHDNQLIPSSTPVLVM